MPVRSIAAAMLCALFVAILASPAEARHHHKRHHHHHHHLVQATEPTIGVFDVAPSRTVRLDRGPAAAVGLASQYLPHPAGCPHRAFCGCGTSVEVFGRPIRSLFLAANWLRFPRTSPAPGMVAARRGHVFVLKEHIGGSTWRVYDANSGGRRTRLHARSIAGFAIVNPHGGPS